MKSRIKILIWTVVACTMLLIFLPSQIASDLLSLIAIIVFGITSLIAQVILLKVDEPTSSNKLQYLVMFMLTIAIMVLIRFV